MGRPAPFARRKGRAQAKRVRGVCPCHPNQRKPHHAAAHPNNQHLITVHHSNHKNHSSDNTPNPQPPSFQSFKIMPILVQNPTTLPCGRKLLLLLFLLLTDARNL